MTDYRVYHTRAEAETGAQEMLDALGDALEDRYPVERDGAGHVVRIYGRNAKTGEVNYESGWIDAWNAPVAIEDPEMGADPYGIPSAAEDPKNRFDTPAVRAKWPDIEEDLAFGRARGNGNKPNNPGQDNRPVVPPGRPEYTLVRNPKLREQPE